MKAATTVLAMAAMLGGGLPQIRSRSKSKREVNDEMAWAGQRLVVAQEAKYRAMLIRTGRVKDYGHCIAINQRNADRKAVKYQFSVR